MARTKHCDPLNWEDRRMFCCGNNFRDEMSTFEALAYSKPCCMVGQTYHVFDASLFGLLLVVYCGGCSMQ